MKLNLYCCSIIFIFTITACVSKDHEALYKEKTAFYSYIIGDVWTDNVDREYASEVYTTPASCQKVITSLVALKALGPEYRYETTLFINKKNDAIIKFSGDPTLTSEQLITLLKPLKNSKFSGNIILDASLFKTPVYSPNLMICDIGTNYATGVSAINIDKNLAGTQDFQQYILYKMRKILEALNIKGKIKIVYDECRITSDFRMINSIKSEALKEIIIPAMKSSDNLVFDSIYLTLTHKNQAIEINDWNQGGVIIKELIREHFSMDMKDSLFVDGSGLSRYNRIQPKLLLALLKSGFAMPDFVNSLAKPGEEKSTLKNRTTLPSYIIAKTGGMSGISCLCGYNLKLHNRPKAFVFMANSFAPPAKNLLDVIDNFITHQ